jgi:hypothetical protein
LTAISTEYRRVTRNMDLMLRQSSYREEVPTQIHGRALGLRDDTNPSIRLHPTTESRIAHDGLGAPDFAPDFERYLAAAGVCMCEWLDEDGEVIHSCDRDERVARFRASRRRAAPRRLKAALRQLRRLSPPSFDIIFPVVARGQSLDQVLRRVNDGRQTRGQEPYTDTEFGVHVIAGLDLLTTIF